MPHFDYHCQTCFQQPGHSYPRVHKWLDAYFGKSSCPGILHRRERHHQAGVEQIKQRYGEGAAKAAVIHIKQDLKEIGWIEGKDKFPKNKKHYEKIEQVLLERYKEANFLWWE